MISHRAFAVGPVFVWRIFAPVSASEVAEVQREMLRLARERPNPICLVVSVQGFRWLPDAASRDAARALLDAGRGRLAGLAVVFETEGFRASIMRSVLAGILNTRGQGFPVGIYSTGAEGHRFIEETLGSPGLASRLDEEVGRIDAEASAQED